MPPSTTVSNFIVIVLVFPVAGSERVRPRVHRASAVTAISTSRPGFISSDCTRRGGVGQPRLPNAVELVEIARR